MTSSPSNLFIRSATMPCNGKRRKKTCRHRRSPTYTTKRHKEQAQSSTKALNSGDYSDKAVSDSPDPDASSTNNMGSQGSREENSEATSQDESTEEYSSQEDTPISEASRAAIKIEMLRSQLNLWEQQRRKRSSKRHNRGTRSRRECQKTTQEIKKIHTLTKTKTYTQMAPRRTGNQLSGKDSHNRRTTSQHQQFITAPTSQTPGRSPTEHRNSTQRSSLQERAH